MAQTDKSNGTGSPSTASAAQSVSFASLSSEDKQAVLRAAASSIVQRLQFAAQAGWDSYGTARNLFTALGLPNTINSASYMQRYERGGIAKTLVETLPNEMWGRGVSVVESEDPEENTQFDKDVASLFKRLDVIGQMTKADIVASLGTYSIILIGAKDRPNTELSTPLPRLSGPDSVLYLTVYSDSETNVDRLIDDTSNKLWGHPEIYNVNTGQVINGVASARWRKVHYSRVIHVAHDLLNSTYIGKPALQWGWNDLEALYKLVWGGAEAAWRRMDQGNHIELDPEREFTTEYLNALADNLDDFRHGLERDIITKGVKVNPLTAGVHNFGPNADTVLDLIAGTYRIPKRVLLGSERGELASSQDRKNLDNTVSRRGDKFGEPLLRAFINRLVEFGGIAKPTKGDNEYLVIWAEEEELDEQEKGGLTETLANANQAQAQASGRVILTEDEIRDRVWGLEPLPKEEDNETDPSQEIQTPDGGTEESDEIETGGNSGEIAA